MATFPATSQSIPVIDISPFVTANASIDSKLLAANQLRQACENVGFFYITNHGVDRELIAEAFDQSQLFFQLPLEEKKETNLNSICRGYFAVDEEITLGLGDHKEGFDLGLELPNDHPDVLANKPLHGPNQWPKNLPSFRTTMTQYSDAIQKLGSLLMQGIALSLDLEEKYFEQYYGENNVIFLRVLHYPRSETPKIGVGTHSDYGCITILAQDDVGGLQVQTREGKWIEATPIKDTFVVNIGDMLQIWTSGLFKATPHQVITSTLKDRYSLAFCYEPNFEAVIHPIPRILEDHSQSSTEYSSIKYGDHVMKKLTNSFPGTYLTPETPQNPV